MIPILLGALALIAILLLLRTFVSADPHELALALRYGGIVLLAFLALVLLFVRQPAAALIAGTAAVLGYGLLRARLSGWWTSRPRHARSGMTRDEALKVLGLQDGATADEIRAAHRRLMQQMHPDHGGSDYLAAKINEAKDVLLGE